MADQYQLPPEGEPNTVPPRPEGDEPAVPIENVQPPGAPSGRSPRNRRWLPLLLIGGGVLLFLANAGAFASIAWSVLLPLAMLAVGLDLITEGRSRRRIAIGALVAAPLLVLLVGGANMLRGAASDAQQPIGGSSGNVQLEGIERLRVDIKQSAANVKLRALDGDSGELYETDGPSPVLRREGNTGVLVVHRSGWEDGNIEVSLTPNLPLDITVEVNGGNADLNELEQTRLENLQLNVRAGNAELSLPEYGVIDVTVQSTAGNVEVFVPEQLAARVEADASLGNLDIDEDKFAARDGAWFSSSYDEQATDRATLSLTARTGNIEVE